MHSRVRDQSCRRRKLDRSAVPLVLILAGVACVDLGMTHNGTAFAGAAEADTTARTDRETSDFPVVGDPKPLTPLMARELRGCFDFFWNEWVSDPKSPTHGLTNGDYVGLGWYSPIPVESQGFYLAAIVIGVEREWITRKEGYGRAVIALKTLGKLKHIRGFYYHFIDPDTGLRGWNCPASVGNAQPTCPARELLSCRHRLLDANI